VVNDLLEFDDPRQALGEVLTIKSKKFTVIGVLDEVGVSFGPFSYDRTIYIPQAAAERYLIKSDDTSSVSAVVENVEDIDKAKEDITALLREEYNLSEDDSDGFIFIDAGATIGIATDVAKILSFLLLGISVIILIVSGIGIMNVMFA
jgi:putative ABC transport system permease protein